MAVVADSVRFASPDAYTPDHLTAKILRSKAALEGERKQVTVLFADLKGSLELLLEDRDPEEARALLDPVIDRMIDAVHHYEGTVNQVMGDGIMALFGAPVAHEDHAVRACYAALRMQEAVKQYADDVHRAKGVPLHIRVGLNSGEVVVRSIAHDLRVDYTAVGQTTHLAARMQQMAMPGRTLITARTLQSAAGWVAARLQGPRVVKGLDAPVEVYELIGAGAARTRLHAAAARGFTRFVGRDSEMAWLRQALDRAADHHGQILAVVGEPGVGKSRLFHEFVHSSWTQGWLVLETTSISYGRASAYLPLIDLLKSYFRVDSRDDKGTIQDKVTAKLLTFERELESARPALLALLDAPIADAQWERLDPLQRRQRTIDAVRQLLLREARRQPLLLVVEDLHWIDSETQALLDDLVDSLFGAQLLLLVNYRPEYRHGWGGKMPYSQLAVDALPRAGAEELLQAMLGDAPALRSLKERLIERTEGNPFFLEEAVRTLVETGVLAGKPGRYALARPVTVLPIGPTAEAVVAARIDRLPTAEKRLLQCAAVIGKDVPVPLLCAVADAPEEAVRGELAHLQAAEFLYETRLFPDLEYTFKHALTHEMAYRGMLSERRRALHARIVDAIEAIGPERQDEHVEALARHAFHGDVGAKAVTYTRAAGAKAFKRSVHREAIAWFEQALEALARLPETPETLAQAIDLRIDLRNALMPVGEVTTVLDHLRVAEALAASLGDRRRQGWVWSYMSACHWVLGSYEAAAEAAARTRALAIELEDTPLQVYASLALGWTYHSLGDYRRGVAIGMETTALLRGDRVWEHFGIPSLPAVIARTWLAAGLAEQGDFAPARAEVAEAVRLAEAIDEPWSLVSAYLGSGMVSLRAGDFDEAIAILKRGLDVCQRHNIQVWLPPLASSLGYARALVGQLDEAAALLTRATDQAVATGLFFFYSAALIWLAETHRLGGRLDEATRVAREAVALCRARGETGNRAHALRALGEIAASVTPPRIEEAGAAFAEALGLAETLSMWPLQAHCRVGLGRLWHRAGQHAAATDQLTTAAASFDALGMAPWAERARALLAEVRP